MKAYRITIQLQQVHPLMWREVMIPATATFEDLHRVIQQVSNFTGWALDEAGSLFEFNLPEENLRITNDEKAYVEHQTYRENREAVEKRHGDSAEETRAFNEPRLRDLETEIKKPEELHIGHYLEKYQSLEYVYDFEEKWRFIVGYVKIDEAYGKNHPLLLDGAEAAPIENLGGPQGYEEFLQAYEDPKHPQHQSVKEWAKNQGYREYDPERINQKLREMEMQQ